MRLFIALPLPSAVRESLAHTATRLRPRLPPARWVPAANLHLTLQFLGEIERPRATELGRALAGCFGSRRWFRLGLRDGGCFPPGRPARVAWVGCSRSDDLMRLQAAVAAAACGHLGIEPDRRPYHPHLTLARPRRPWPRAAVERWHKAFAGPQGPEFEVAEGRLMRSHLGPGGARHECLEAYPLAGF